LTFCRIRASLSSSRASFCSFYLLSLRAGVMAEKLIYVSDTWIKCEKFMNEKLKGMRELVKSEMKHIWRGDYAQNELRMFYWPLRMNSLGKKRAKMIETKEGILKKAIEMVRKTHPDFEPQYNKEFFKLEPGIE
jgi:hypothetical protein